MKNSIIALSPILFAICMVVFMPTKAAAQTITIECPLSIQTGILNVPQDWSAEVAPGARRINFQEIILSKENGKPTVGCYYSNEQGKFALFSLRRTLPANFLCKVNNGIEKPRSVSCVPVIKLKKN
jgi:hypothetical protein